MNNPVGVHAETDTLNQDELKDLLRAGLKRKTKSKKVLEWFEFEFHTIYEAGRFNGVETVFYGLKRKNA